MIKKTFFPALLYLLLLPWALAGELEFPIADKSSIVNFYVDANSEDLIKWAVNDFAEDLEKITGKKVPVSYIDQFDPEAKGVVIGRFDNKLIRTSPAGFGGRLEGQWEKFVLEKHGNNLFAVGSDTRGTVYAIFEMAERIGISPWKWWADVEPLRKESISLYLPSGGIEQSPSVQYRGIFLNDEDWGLQPWAASTFEPETGDIGPKTYEKIFQLLLRLKANTIWPAMHPSTRAFFAIPGNQDMAKKYRIYVGTSHAEPMLRNNVDEWNSKEYGDYNYFTNKKNINAYWQKRVEEAKEGEYLFTVGMRGIHDSGMEGNATQEEKIQLLEGIISDQRQMLGKTLNKPAQDVPQTFIPYKEVLELYNGGMQVPEDITLVWPDDNYGYIRRLSNASEQQRKGGSGVYYHLSYWGRPHDYLWLSTTQPGLIWYEMSRAYQNGARKIWIANVGDIKPAEYTMEFFLDLAWDAGSIKADSINDHLLDWSRREFGDTKAHEIAGVLAEYYRLAFLRKPEYMGWSRTEPQTETRPTEFTLRNDNELQRRIDDYTRLYQLAERLKSSIPQQRRDAYFQLVEYPVKSAALMNFKFLRAQQSMLSGGADEKSELTGLARQAHEEIAALTREYNGINNGKWQKMMSMNPRELPVFDMPSYHLSGTGESMDGSVATGEVKPVAIQASEYQLARGADSHEWKVIDGLGYSGASVTLLPFDNHLFEEKRPFLEYEFSVDKPGDYEVQIRFLPTHANDFDFEVGVAVNGESRKDFAINTSGRSDAWKENVLRNAVLVSHPVTLAGSGKQTLRIFVNRTGIVLDQIAVHPQGYGSYYEITN